MPPRERIPLHGHTGINDGGALHAASSATDSGGSAGAPTDASYLVGAAHSGLSGEIVVGTTPGGELGGTWASPTVDATHSGSTHAATQAAAEATAAAALALYGGANALLLHNIEALGDIPLGLAEL